MGGANEELTGPDLAAGVPEADLADGATLLGHAHGDAVLVVRRGGEIHAVAAKCTHYGGPLADGLVDGDTVRCPWHHACFDLRTGEALHAPALVDLATWDVDRSEGLIRVLRRRDALGPAAAGRARGRRPADPPASVLILGAGAAGGAAAETLRREGYDGLVTLLDPDPDAPYDRPNLSKDYLAGNAPEEWIPLHPPAFWEENGIRFIRQRAVSMDTRSRAIVLGDGNTLGWDALLLATGAEPVQLSLPTAADARVRYLRSLADSRAIISDAASARRVVVVGASFIGLEVAASLRHRGIDVSVVAPEPRPLERIMGPQLGDFVRRIHEEHGVVFHLQRTVRQIGAKEVVLGTGERVAADLVVIGAGVRPRVALAQAAGLAVDDGIVVDERLRTSVPTVWAAGDAARFPDPRTGGTARIEHWAFAQRMGAAAARSILGAEQRFDAVPFFWSQHYDATIAYVGHAAEWDRAELDGDPDARDCAVSFYVDGRRHAFASIFRDIDSLRAEVEMERATRS